MLPHVELGTITLIGATTENPYFEVIGALVSRSRIFQLRPLLDQDVEAILQAALHDPQRGYGTRSIQLEPDETVVEHEGSLASCATPHERVEDDASPLNARRLDALHR